MCSKINSFNIHLSDLLPAQHRHQRYRPRLSLPIIAPPAVPAHQKDRCREPETFQKRKNIRIQGFQSIIESDNQRALRGRSSPKNTSQKRLERDDLITFICQPAHLPCELPCRNRYRGAFRTNCMIHQYRNTPAAHQRSTPAGDQAITIRPPCCCPSVLRSSCKAWQSKNPSGIQSRIHKLIQ